MTAFNADGAAWVDEGLGGFLKTVPRFAGRAAENLGKQMVPTLRNVDRRSIAGLCQVLYAQRRAEDAEGGGALLQHARHQADLRGAGDAEARRQLLAFTGGGRQRQYRGTGRSGTQGRVAPAPGPARRGRCCWLGAQRAALHGPFRRRAHQAIGENATAQGHPDQAQDALVRNRLPDAGDEAVGVDWSKNCAKSRSTT